MAEWTIIGVVVEGQPISVAGINLWEFDWHRTEADYVELPHPQHPSELHRMWIHEIEADGKTVKFAAGELSANVWGSYVPAS